MSKRGETRPHLVEYKWSTGIHATSSFPTKDQADDLIAKIRRAEDLHPDGATVEISYTDRTAEYADAARSAGLRRQIEALAAKASDDELREVLRVLGGS